MTFALYLISFWLFCVAYDLNEIKKTLKGMRRRKDEHDSGI